MSANIFRGTAQQHDELCPLGFPLWGHLKPYCIRLQFEISRHVTKAFLMPVKPFLTALDPFEGVRKSIRRGHACIELGGEHLSICCER